MSAEDQSDGAPATAEKYFAQLILPYPLVFLVSLPLSGILRLVGLSGDYPRNTHFAGYDAIACLFAGALVGWIAAKKMPRLSASGRWIWVLPWAVNLPGMIASLRLPQLTPWLPELFFATGDNEGLATVLLTLPAFCALGYSMGMALASPKSGSGLRLRQNIREHAVVYFAGATAFLFILTAGAHGFAASRVEAASRIHSVIVRNGLRLSFDASQLCAAPESSPGSLMESGTIVEFLEQRKCFKGRLMDQDSPSWEDGWSVERVRSLNSGKRGLEGWILAYGVR
jgi:hypothetical protein